MGAIQKDSDNQEESKAKDLDQPVTKCFYLTLQDILYQS
jgi:hypothetical protein